MSLLPQEDRRALDIWSTRLQKELLSLTCTDGNDSSIDSGSGMAHLPEFVKVKEHKLDIENGICTVSFMITVEGYLSEKESAECSTAIKHEKINDGDNGDDTTLTEGAVKTESKIQTKMVTVTITLDASLNSASSHADPSRCYPFQKPKAILTEGACHFPPGSRIADLDTIDIDCDWTPSLHLNDAALNISLKVRESIKRSEPFYRKDEFEMAMDVVADTVAASSAKVSSFFNSLRNRASAMADEMDVALDSNEKKKSSKPKKRKKKVIGKIKKLKETSTSLNIGDVINLSEEPWNQCAGIYSCKALKRPGFCKRAIANSDTKEQQVSLPNDESRN